MYGASAQASDATRSDGSPYQGDIIDDVLTYRMLRIRSLQGEALGEGEPELLQRLEGVLCGSRDESSGYERIRLYYRFTCAFPARLKYVVARTDAEEDALRTSALPPELLPPGFARRQRSVPPAKSGQPGAARKLEGTGVVRDISAGGVKMEVDHHAEIGQEVELRLAVAAADFREVSFRARVAWAKPGELGLQFAGVPRWADAPAASDNQ